MLQRLRQEWPWFRCSQNPMHPNLGKTEDIPCNSLDTCKIRYPYRKHPRFRCCQNPVHPNLKKTEDIPCNSLDTCKIRHLYRKRTWFRCFNGANGKCAAESAPEGVWQKWLCKSPMHLNAGAGRRKRGKTLSKRMLQRLRQEWPRFRCCQNPVHLNLKKTEDIPYNSLDTCKIRHPYRKHPRFRCFNGAKGKCAAESTPDGV